MTEPAGRSPYPDLGAGVSRETLARMDDTATCSEHWKILITAGMGFFADAYDLFIIGVAATILTVEWHIADYQKSLLSSLALLISASVRAGPGVGEQPFGDQLAGARVVDDIRVGGQADRIGLRQPPHSAWS